MDAYSSIFFIITKTWRQPRCPSSECRTKLWYIQVVEYYSVLQRNEVSSHKKAWSDPKCTLLSERSQYPHACQIAFSHTWLFQPYGLEPARLLCPWDSPGKNTGVGCHALQGIFPTQGSIPYLLCLLHWQAGSLPLAPPGKSPWCPFLSQNIIMIIIFVFYSFRSTTSGFNNSHIPGGAVSGSSWFQTWRCQVRSPFEKGLIPSPRVQPTGSLQL